VRDTGSDPRWDWLGLHEVNTNNTHTDSIAELLAMSQSKFTSLNSDYSVLSLDI